MRRIGSAEASPGIDCFDTGSAGFGAEHPVAEHIVVDGHSLAATVVEEWAGHMDCCHTGICYRMDCTICVSGDKHWARGAYSHGDVV